MSLSHIFSHPQPSQCFYLHGLSKSDDMTGGNVVGAQCGEHKMLETTGSALFSNLHQVKCSPSLPPPSSVSVHAPSLPHSHIPSSNHSLCRQTTLKSFSKIWPLQVQSTHSHAKSLPDLQCNSGNKQTNKQCKEAPRKTDYTPQDF